MQELQGVGFEVGIFTMLMNFNTLMNSQKTSPKILFLEAWAHDVPKMIPSSYGQAYGRLQGFRVG